jgi:AcrR family transcriptional regulator
MSTAEAVLGRPRDPAVDHRIREATLELYATHGWQGFTLDAVAREAKVGKSALYRRWSNKEDLLVHVLLGINDLASVDTGSLREDLLVLAQQFVDAYFGPHRIARIRFQVESEIIPELADAGESTTRGQVLAGRGIIRRGIARGELPPNASPTVLMAMLHGAVVTHSLSYPRHLEERVRRELPAFVEDLVDAVIASSQKA